METPPFLAVARFAKPHGLKGEAVVFVLTDNPDEIFVADRVLTPIDEAGEATGRGHTIERARAYHRRWLVKFADISDRAGLAPLVDAMFGVRAGDLDPPADGQMYVHEIPGATVVAHGDTIGVARELLTVPGGQVLAVEREGREVLIPFRAPILVGVDRARRTIEVDPPAGLLEL